MAAFLLLIVSATAQVVVYEGKLERSEGQGINYNFFDRCFVAIPVDGGEASVVFYTKFEREKTYVQLSSATYAIAENRKDERGVLFSGIEDDGAMISLVAAGKMLRRFRIPGETLTVPRVMDGQLISSGDNTYVGKDGSQVVGFAGIMDLHLTFASGRSRLANSGDSVSTDASGAISDVISFLEERGYTDGDASPNTSVETEEEAN